MKKYVTTITVAVFFFTVGLFVSSAFARQDKMTMNGETFTMQKS